MLRLLDSQKNFDWGVVNENAWNWCELWNVLRQLANFQKDLILGFIWFCSCVTRLLGLLTP